MLNEPSILANGQPPVPEKPVQAPSDPILRARSEIVLEVLGKQLDIPVHSEGDKVPPPKICANAVKRAREAAYSVVLLDTAGRLQNKGDLMSELAKVVRVLKKFDAEAPHTVLLVLDATTGQNALGSTVWCLRAERGSVVAQLRRVNPAELDCRVQRQDAACA